MRQKKRCLTSTTDEMATSMLYFSKLQEFVAHESNVNCLALGQISGRVLVTGGDDKKVNLWAIGTTSYVLSLNAHTNPVECVKFGHTEEFVCSGSQAGQLNIWDLEANKKTRTFEGHIDAIKCMDFHPYGDFLTSGSLDTSIKLWDLRRRGCISNYRGHTLTVNSVRFSPDGLWVASGGDDGRVKLWDVRVGRQLQEFTDHTGPVLAVEFHPHEFLLATGSSDGTVNFWDLEKFQLVSTTDRDAAAVSCLYFEPEGECLYAAVEDSLKVYGWEPARTFDSVATKWGKMHDIVKTPNQLIGASFHRSKVTLQAVDLTHLRTTTKKEYNNKVATNFVHGQTGRKSFSKEKMSPQRLSLKVAMEDVADRSGPEEEPLEPSAIFQPQRVLSRTPPPIPEPLSPQSEPDYSIDRLCMPTSESEPISLSSVESGVGASSQRVQLTVRSPSPRLIHKEMSPTAESKREHHVHHQQQHRATARQVVKKTKSIPPPPEPSDGSPRRQHNVAKYNPAKEAPSADSKTDFPIKMNNIRHSPSEPSLNRPTTRVRKNSLTPHYNGPVEIWHGGGGGGDNHVSAHNVKDKTPRPVAPVLPSLSVSPTYFGSNQNIPARCESSPEDDFVPMMSDKPTGLNMDDFLPKNSSAAFSLSPSGVNMSEAECLSSIARDHNSMRLVLENRDKSLRVVYSLWHNKDPRAAVDSAVSMGDQSVIVDLLSVLVLRPPIWNLDMCGSVLPSILDLLQSKYELHMTTGCSALSLILRNFAHLIKTNVNSPINTVGVDISREERYNKSLKCYKSLLSIRAFLLKRQTMQGKLGHSFRELLILMEGFEN